MAVSREILNSHPVGNLKKEIAKTNIRGYSKMKKSELVDVMMKNKERFGHIKHHTKAPRAKPAPKAKPAPTKKEKVPFKIRKKATPKPPTPKAPTPKAPSPKAPTPKPPTPKAPTPKAKTPSPKPLTKKELNAMNPLELFGKLPTLAKLNILDPKTTGILVGDKLKSMFKDKLFELSPYVYKNITGDVYYRYEGRRKRDNKAIFMLVNKYNDIEPNDKGKPIRKYFTMEEFDKQLKGRAKGYSNARIVNIQPHYRADEDDENFDELLVKELRDFNRVAGYYLTNYYNTGKPKQELIKISKQPDFEEYTTQIESPGLLRVVNESGVNIGYSSLTTRPTIDYHYNDLHDEINLFLVNDKALPDQLLNEKQFEGILDKFKKDNGYYAGFKIIYPKKGSKYLKEFGKHIVMIKDDQKLPRLP